MPTILKWNGYRFYFFSNEGSEPPHIHIDKDESTAKFWLSPVTLASNSKFRDNQLKELENKIHENQKQFLKAWYEHFKSHS